MIFSLTNQSASNEPKNETKNKCSFCDKTFACHSQVKNHEIVHSEEKVILQTQDLPEIASRNFLDV